MTSSTCQLVLFGWNFFCLSMTETSHWRLLQRFVCQSVTNLERKDTHHVLETVFPAFDVCNHGTLRAGHKTQFALIVRWDRLTRAAILPNAHKTCGHACNICEAVQRGTQRRVTASLLTNNAIVDSRQLFWKRRQRLERWSLHVHCKNNNSSPQI